MHLSSDLQIPDGLLAANALLDENSRQGFGTSTHTLYQGFEVAISSTAIGISGTLYDTRTESRYTGKERDAESGLDYFGARYYASSMGRWMSPDWSAKQEPVPYAKLGDPQSLNLYGYVGNNPLSMADLDGHCCQWLKDFGNGLANSTYRPLGQMISHPVDALHGMGSALSHPIATAQAAWGGIKTTSVSVTQGDGTAIGTAVGSAAMFFVPGGEEAEAAGSLSKLNLLGKAGEAAEGAAKASSYEEGLAAAQEAYPGKAGNIENHHIDRKYLGGDPSGATVPIDAAYHQQITNAFRNEAPYGSGPVSAERLQQIKDTVYSQHPLPGPPK